MSVYNITAEAAHPNDLAAAKAQVAAEIDAAINAGDALISAHAYRRDGIRVIEAIMVKGARE